MKVSDFKKFASEPVVEGKAIFVSPPVEKETSKGKMQMRYAHLADDKDVLKITIWGNMEKFKTNDNVRIHGGKISIFQNEPQLNIGENTKVEIFND